MTDRIPLDELSSDQYDALYDRLEAAEATESQRQLTVAREAFASATTRAAKAEAKLARVRDLHHPTEGMGYRRTGGYGSFTACTSCGHDEEYAVPYPCPTIQALDEA